MRPHSTPDVCRYHTNTTLVIVLIAEESAPVFNSTSWAFVAPEWVDPPASLGCVTHQARSTTASLVIYLRDSSGNTFDGISLLLLDCMSDSFPIETTTFSEAHWTLFALFMSSLYVEPKSLSIHNHRYISASDADGGSDATVTFRVTDRSDSASPLLELNGTTGEVLVVRRPNASLGEQRQTVQLLVQATDGMCVTHRTVRIGSSPHISRAIFSS